MSKLAAEREDVEKAAKQREQVLQEQLRTLAAANVADKESLAADYAKKIEQTAAEKKNVEYQLRVREQLCSLHYFYFRNYSNLSKFNM